MKREELLAKIDRYSKGSSLVDSVGWNSIKAIIELHNIAGDTKDYCEHCSLFNEENPYLTVEYPCPTIQAIESNMK